MPEICGNAALLVDPENMNDLVSAMEKILGSEERKKLLDEMKVQIRKFSWKKCAAATFHVFKEVQAESYKEF